jgi:cysteine sulfinate desulfinase/cysteine desulfurase-like protein
MGEEVFARCAQLLRTAQHQICFTSFEYGQNNRPVLPVIEAHPAKKRQKNRVYHV